MSSALTAISTFQCQLGEYFALIPDGVRSPLLCNSMFSKAGRRAGPAAYRTDIQVYGLAKEVGLCVPTITSSTEPRSTLLPKLAFLWLRPFASLSYEFPPKNNFDPPFPSLCTCAVQRERPPLLHRLASLLCQLLHPQGGMGLPDWGSGRVVEL